MKEKDKVPPNNDNDKEMEELSRAIVEAILGSGDVKTALEKLQEMDAAARTSFILRS